MQWHMNLSFFVRVCIAAFDAVKHRNSISGDRHRCFGEVVFIFRNLLFESLINTSTFARTCSLQIINFKKPTLRRRKSWQYLHSCDKIAVKSNNNSEGHCKCLRLCWNTREISKCDIMQYGKGIWRFSNIHKSLKYYFNFNLLLQSKWTLNGILFYIHIITSLFISFWTAHH